MALFIFDSGNKVRWHGSVRGGSVYTYFVDGAPRLHMLHASIFGRQYTEKVHRAKIDAINILAVL